MKKLTCLQFEDTDPSRAFLINAKTPLMDFWHFCEGRPGWAALVRSFNRLVDGRFFASDPAGAATLLGILAAVAEERAKNRTVYQPDQRHAIERDAKKAREAGSAIVILVESLEDRCQVEEDVNAARFHTRQGRT